MALQLLKLPSVIFLDEPTSGKLSLSLLLSLFLFSHSLLSYLHSLIPPLMHLHDYTYSFTHAYFLPPGLDAASSRELLAHLNDLAASNRTVVLTIHQPRLEIFHMFHRLVLLSDGKVCKPLARL